MSRAPLRRHSRWLEGLRQNQGHRRAAGEGRQAHHRRPVLHVPGGPGQIRGHLAHGGRLGRARRRHDEEGRRPRRVATASRGRRVRRCLRERRQPRHRLGGAKITRWPRYWPATAIVYRRAIEVRRRLLEWPHGRLRDALLRWQVAEAVANNKERPGEVRPQIRLTFISGLLISISTMPPRSCEEAISQEPHCRQLEDEQHHSRGPGVAQFLPAYAGALMDLKRASLVRPRWISRGSERLCSMIPHRPFVAILGGSKVSDKVTPSVGESLMRSSFNAPGATSSWIGRPPVPLWPSRSWQARASCRCSGAGTSAYGGSEWGNGAVGRACGAQGRFAQV